MNLKMQVNLEKSEHWDIWFREVSYFNKICYKNVHLIIR
jgi:hypothetical protein